MTFEDKYAADEAAKELEKYKKAFYQACELLSVYFYAVNDPRTMLNEEEWANNLLEGANYGNSNKR